jgi:hypothetical protein
MCHHSCGWVSFLHNTAPSISVPVGSQLPTYIHSFFYLWISSMPSQADVLTAFSEEALHDFQRPYQPPGKGLDSSGIPGYYKGRLKHATAEDVNSAVSHYSTAVLERWNTLKSRYTERHQDIKDGWLAMNNKTRRTVLLGALPGIPKDHSPSLESMARPHRTHQRR